jgi:hypothetical protein
MIPAVGRQDRDASRQMAGARCRFERRMTDFPREWRAVKGATHIDRFGSEVEAHERSVKPRHGFFRLIQATNLEGSRRPVFWAFSFILKSSGQEVSSRRTRPELN